MNIDALLDDAGSKTKAKKSSVPTFKATAKVAKAITEFKKAKSDSDTATAKMKTCEDDILPEALKVHLEEVRKKGEPFTTIKLTADDGIDITIDVAKKQYSKINTDSEDDLRKRFGAEYENMFEKKRDVKLTDAALEDKEILSKLIKAVGKENFSKYFKVDNYITPTTKFHTARFIDDDKKMNKVVTEVISEGVVVPYKPAFKG